MRHVCIARQHVERAITMHMGAMIDVDKVDDAKSTKSNKLLDFGSEISPVGVSHETRSAISTTPAGARYNAMMLISTHRGRPSRDRDAHAIRLRDLAMQVVTAHQVLSYRDNFLVIEFRPRVGDRPSGLDIWLQHDLDHKALSVLWHDTESIVISYRSGSWEAALRRAAARADALAS
jgi:hypothetical protein